MKPKFNTSRLRSQHAAGASLITAITICFGGTALATDWVGSTSTDWNVDANWSGGAGTGGSQANINVASPVATISANIVATPVDIVVGDGSGISGRLDHVAGTAQTGPGNWMKVGRAGGTGVYNLANTAGTGGTFTGFGQGTGTMNVKGRLYIGGENGSGSNGTLNVNTTGNLAMDSEFNIGTNASVGVVNVDSGTVTNNNWLRVGAGGDAAGTLNVSGGSVTKSGNDHFIVGDNGGSTGVVTLNAGTITVNNECWIGQAGGTGTVNINGGTIANNSWVAIGRANAASHGTVNQTGGTWNKTGGGHYIIGDNSVGTYNLSGTGQLSINGEFWVGQGGSGNGTLNLSGGKITSNNWVAVGREGGTSAVTMTGGEWIKTGDGSQFIVGASGPSLMNMSGGLVDVQGGFTWIGEGGGASSAVLNISSTAEFRSPIISVGPESPNATLNLNGGTVRTHRFSGTRERDANQQNGTGTIHFNGTQIIGTANDSAFFNQVDNTIIDAGGLLVNTNGFNLAAPSQILSGAGGVVKSGLGTLTLNGVNTYGGANVVSAGKLALNSSSTGTGNITLANDAALGVNQSDATKSLASVNVIFGSSAAATLLPTSLDIDLGNTAGNPTVPALNVTGTLTLNRQVVINIADQLPAVGTFPLVNYAGGAKSGTGSFVLGTLPNGVVATLSDNGTGVVSLVVTSASLPTWDGTNETGVTKASTVTEFSSEVTVATLADANAIIVGKPVHGNGIPYGTTVLSKSGTTITLSQQATVSGTGVNLLFVTVSGTNEGVWDFVTENWVNQITNASSVYANPNPVLFNDSATGPTAVVLNTTVTPSSVTFNNNERVYSLAGTGKITGATGVTKAGTSSLSVATTNDYTGATRFEGGTTTVGTLTNGGVAGPLGAATAAPEKLVFAGGTLDYTGGAVSIDRGLSIQAVDNTVVSGLNLAADLTTSGQIAGTLGKLVKSGPGMLTLTNPSNVLATGNGGDNIAHAFRIANGGLTLAVAGQTNTVNGWAAIGTAAGNSSLSLLNGASLTVNGRTAIAQAADSNTTVTIGGTSSLLSTDALQIALGSNSVGNVLIKDSGSITKTGGWLSIGNDAVGTMTIQNNGSVTSSGDFNIGDVGTANGTLTLQDSGKVTSSGNVFVGKNGTTGALVMGDTTTMTGAETNIGGNGSSHGNVTVRGNSVYTSNGRLQVGPGGGSQGNLLIEGSGEFKVNSYVSVGFNGGGAMTVKGSGKFSNTDDFSVNESGDVAATVSVEDSATMSVVRTIYVGRNADRIGTLSASGTAEINQTDAGYSFVVGPLGTGTLNVLGNAKVTSAGASGLVITNSATGVGTVNLDGGTLTVRKVSDAGGTSALHFDGGVLKAGAGADLNFLGGLDTLDVEDGGAIIDSNGQTIAINQGLADQGGGLTKQGAGTLQLNGSNTYFGTTSVTAGALGGTGSVAGELLVSATGAIAPGASGVGTFTVNDGVFMGSVIQGTYVCDIAGAAADKLAVAGDLNITGAKLDIDVLSAPSAPVYVIASYGTLAGTFTVQDLPAGYTVDYNYLGGSQIALVQSSTPYSVWAAGYGLNPLTDGAPGFDKDGDGQTNGVEYALGGSPISSSNNAKIYHLEADSSDAGSNKELLMTIAVRSGTPAFSPLNGGLPTATHEGAIYTIQGSPDLAAFAGTVSVVTTVVPPAPNATPPAGYEYRTFSLDGSDGLPSKGFLRVKISN